MNRNTLTQGLEVLGEALEKQQLHFDLVVVGGGALLLRGLIERPTTDLDAVARIENGVWVPAKPLPEALVAAIREVAEPLGLPREPRDAKDWLNPGPSILVTLGLPDGFEQRTEVQVFGGLTLRVASRTDLIILKLWSATTLNRGQRRDVDVQDLRDLKPTEYEIKRAVAWCAVKDGRPGFVELEAAPVLRGLGFDPSEFVDE